MLRIIQRILVTSCLFIRSYPFIDTDISHKKIFSQGNLYFGTFVCCKSRLTIVLCYSFIFNIHMFTVVI